MGSDGDGAPAQRCLLEYDKCSTQQGWLLDGPQGGSGPMSLVWRRVAVLHILAHREVPAEGLIDVLACDNAYQHRCAVEAAGIALFILSKVRLGSN